MNKRNTILILSIILIIFIRIPLVQHETHPDTHFVNTLSQLILKESYIFWNSGFISNFGYAPHSTEVALPLLFSEVSSILSINAEITILLCSIVFSLVAFFGAFQLMGKFVKNFPFQILCALFYSLAPTFIKYTYWSGSQRGLILTILPFFFISLIDLSNNIRVLRNWVQFVCISILVLMSHKLSVLIVIPIVIAMIFSIKPIYPFFVRYRIYFTLGALAITTIAIIFFSTHMDPDWMQKYVEYDFPIKNEIVRNIADLSYIVVARYGILLFLGIVGLLLMSSASALGLPELTMYFSFLVIIPFLFQSQYVLEFTLPFFCIFSTLFLLRQTHTINKIVVPLIIIIIVSFSVFTVQHRLSNRHNYLTSETVALGNYIQEQDIRGFFSPSSYHIYPLLNYDKIMIGDDVINNITLGGKGLLDSKMRDLPTNMTGLFFFIRSPFIANASDLSYLETCRYIRVFEGRQKYTEYVDGILKYRMIQPSFNKLYDNGYEQLWMH
jgi:hypothetical protein